MKLQENSPKFDIIVTREIKKGKEKETLKYFSILVAKNTGEEVSTYVSPFKSRWKYFTIY